MKKIIFLDLYALSTAISFFSKHRLIIGHTDTPQLIWRGPEGFHTNLLTILDFQHKYLNGVGDFDKIADLLKDLTKKIPQSEFEQQLINIGKHKETLFQLLNVVETLEQKIAQHYSLNTLFQFSNITFNSDILFSKIEDVFESDTWEFIPEFAKSDIVEGGKALLFNLPTCASFMFLRALEDCIRKLCLCLIPNQQNLTFGSAINILIKEKDKFDLKLKDFDRQINFLNYIKDEFRNPSAHPDKSFSQKEAEQLFQVVNVAIDKLNFLSGKVATD